eukprot:jgi/Chrzof1/11727/Cz06g07070.t1
MWCMLAGVVFLTHRRQSVDSDCHGVLCVGGLSWCGRAEFITFADNVPRQAGGGYNLSYLVKALNVTGPLGDATRHLPQAQPDTLDKLRSLQYRVKYQIWDIGFTGTIPNVCGHIIRNRRELEAQASNPRRPPYVFNPHVQGFALPGP